MGKVWVSVSQTLSIPWVLLHFPVLWEIYGETHAFPIWWHGLIFSCGSWFIDGFTEMQLIYLIDIFQDNYNMVIVRDRFEQIQ